MEPPQKWGYTQNTAYVEVTVLQDKSVQTYTVNTCKRSYTNCDLVKNRLECCINIMYYILCINKYYISMKTFLLR